MGMVKVRVKWLREEWEIYMGWRETKKEKQ